MQTPSVPPDPSDLEQSADSRARRTEIAFGKRVRALRKKQKLSQSKFAQRLAAECDLAIDPSTVARIELGERPVKLSEAQAFAEVLETSVSELLGEDQRTTPARLNEMREEAHLWERRARLALHQVARSMAEIQQKLRAHPELLAAFAGEENPPTEPNEYLPWVLGRMEDRVEDFAAQAQASAATGEDAEYLRRITATLTADLVAVDPAAWNDEELSADDGDDFNDG